MSIDRTEASRALAKAIAFKACGQDAKAAAWAAHLVRTLECAEILDTNAPIDTRNGWRATWHAMQIAGEAP